MSEISFDMEGVEQAAVKFEELNLFTRKKVIRQTAKSAFKIEGDAKSNIAVDVGRARASLQTRFENGGLSAIIFSDVDYSRYIEFGRPAGKPPPASALADWARRHGLDGLEYVIARAIGARGIEPRPFLQPAFRAEKSNYLAEVRKIVREMGEI